MECFSKIVLAAVNYFRKTLLDVQCKSVYLQLGTLNKSPDIEVNINLVKKFLKVI